LILLNGPPASGKSTLAARFVESHPLALNLEIDVVRHLLGGWADQPTEAGLLARKIAIGMARTALEAGRDVIIPQLVARPDFVSELERLARDSGVRFVEVALTASKDEMRDWFASRSAAPDAATHLDAELLVDRLGGGAALDQMFDDFVQLVESRPGTRTVPARRDDVERTLRELERVLAEDVSGDDAG
jgi:predicted kinase